MNRQREQILAVIGVMLAVTLVFNDFLTILAVSGESANIYYVIRLLLLAAIVIYAVYLKHESFAARYKLAVYRHAWRQIPCGIALFKKNKLLEICAESDLFNTFGLVLTGSGGDKTALGEPRDRLTRIEECQGSGGERHYADRFVIPLNEFNGGGYTVEILVDATERETSNRIRQAEYFQMFRILVNMFEMKDPYSHGHSEVVSNLSQEIAKALNMEEDLIGTIGRAALFHDIGKIVVPAAIINKTEQLAATEYDIIRLHPKVGADILAGMSLFKEEAIIVRHHHERYDGRGYPAGLSGAAIPAGARIIAVADTFEAMTAGRSALGRRDVGETLAILRQEKGCQFDPEVVDAFIGIVCAEQNPD